jgi:Helicase associated domain.
MEHSHCRVPQRSDAYPQLAQFTKKMRELYRLYQQGQYKGKMLTAERIRELEELGFEWEVRKVKNKSFGERIRDLAGFKEKYGHCNVPRVFKEDVSLGRWCHVMRCSYRQIKENQKPMYKLQPEEIQRLEDMGFRWRVRPPRKRDVDDEERVNGMKKEEEQQQQQEGGAWQPPVRREKRILLSRLMGVMENRIAWLRCQGDGIKLHRLRNELNSSSNTKRNMGI